MVRLGEPASKYGKCVSRGWAAIPLSIVYQPLLAVLESITLWQIPIPATLLTRIYISTRVEKSLLHEATSRILWDFISRSNQVQRYQKMDAVVLTEKTRFSDSPMLMNFNLRGCTSKANVRFQSMNSSLCLRLFLIVYE